MKQEVHLIHRQDMPQIDAEDITALIEWLSWNKVEVTEELAANPADLKFMQEVQWTHKNYLALPDEVYRQPILVSSDGWVLDGNHRAVAHKRKGEPVDKLVIDLPRELALLALFTFAGTYRMIDGKRHAA